MLDGKIVRDEFGKAVKVPGKFKDVKGIGWFVSEFDQAQISLNFNNYKVSTIHEVYDEANKLANEIHKKNKKVKMFIQINLGGEKQKSGIEPNDLETFYRSCLLLKLDIIGTMCIPPDNQDPKFFFKELLNLNNKIKLPEISMGMTNDYLEALEFRSTYLRIGTGIFGKRAN